MCFIYFHDENKEKFGSQDEKLIFDNIWRVLSENRFHLRVVRRRSLEALLWHSRTKASAKHTVYTRMCMCACVCIHVHLSKPPVVDDQCQILLKL